MRLTQKKEDRMDRRTKNSEGANRKQIVNWKTHNQSIINCIKCSQTPQKEDTVSMD